MDERQGLQAQGLQVGASRVNPAMQPLAESPVSSLRHRLSTSLTASQGDRMFPTAGRGSGRRTKLHRRSAQQLPQPRYEAMDDHARVLGDRYRHGKSRKVEADQGLRRNRGAASMSYRTNRTGCTKSGDIRTPQVADGSRYRHGPQR